MLPAGIVFLFTFVNNTLFIQVDPLVRETFICLSFDNVHNETWPSAWKKMNTDHGLFTYKINKTMDDISSIEYKLRFHYIHKSYNVTQQWYKLFEKENEYNLKYFIVLNILFVLLLCMLSFVLIKMYIIKQLM